MTPHEILDRSQLRPRTKREYRRAFDRWLQFAPDPQDWSPIAVEAWRDLLLSQGLQPGTVNIHVNAVRYLGRRLDALGLGPNFTRGAEGVRGSRSTSRMALTVPEARALLETCDRSPIGVRDRAILILGLRTAVRVSGLVALSWGSVRGRQATVEAKGGHPHTVVLDEAAQGALREWRTATRRLLGYAPGADERVFRSLRASLHSADCDVGDSISRQSIWAMISRRGKSAGIRRSVHPHLLRHTFVVWALEAGVPLNRIMAQTGHRSLRTLSIYVSDPMATEDPIAEHLPSLE